MIHAYRPNKHVILEVEADSQFETALLDLSQKYSLVFKSVGTGRAGSRYEMAKNDEGRFNHFVGVDFKKWPRQRSKKRVRAVLRKVPGEPYRCCSTHAEIRLSAPGPSEATVRCGLHAGTYGWPAPNVQRSRGRNAPATGRRVTHE